MLLEPQSPQCIPVNRYKLRLYVVMNRTRTENMILVHALGDFSIPYPPPPQFVSVTTFVEQYVTYL